MLFSDGSQDWKSEYISQDKWINTLKKAYPQETIVFTNNRKNDPSYISATIGSVEVGVWSRIYQDKPYRGLIYSPLMTNLDASSYTEQPPLYYITKKYIDESGRFSVNNHQGNNNVNQFNSYTVENTAESTSIRNKSKKPIIQKVPEWVYFRG